MAQNIWDEYQAAYNQLHLIFIKQTGTTCSNLLMKQNGWIIWQVHLLFPWADGCLLACWQVYDKVFAIFNQVSSFTPISGPAQKQARAEIKRTGRRKRNKFVIKVWMRLFHLIITIWGLFALRLLVSLSPRSSPDLRTQHIIANQLTSQLWYQLSNIPSLPRSLWSFVWQIIARFSELPSAVSNVLSVRAGLECDPLLAPLNSEHSKLSWFSRDAAGEWPS